MLQVGDKAPDFKLPTTGDHELTLADAAASGAAQVSDAAGSDYEEHDEKDQQDLQDADAHQ